MPKSRKNQQKSAPSAVVNRRARFDYALGDELTVGIELTGPETKAARQGHVTLKGAYVSLQNDELWLTNASFSLASHERGENRTVDSRPKKLLAHRKEIDRLSASRQQGYSIIPTKLLTKGRYIKLIIALGKGKKLYDKRETIKKRDQKREDARIAKIR
jgi:SsrA-binding protein